MKVLFKYPRRLGRQVFQKGENEVPKEITQHKDFQGWLASGDASLPGSAPAQKQTEHSKELLEKSKEALRLAQKAAEDEEYAQLEAEELKLKSKKSFPKPQSHKTG